MKNGAENIIHRSLTLLCIATSKHFTGFTYPPQHSYQADKYWLPHSQAEEEEQKKQRPELPKGFIK